MSMSTIEVDENYSQLGDNLSYPPGKEHPELQPFFSLNGIRSQLNFLLGDVLTIMDATVSNVVQNKALKDIIKQKFWDRSNHFSDMFYGETKGAVNIGSTTPKDLA